MQDMKFWAITLVVGYIFMFGLYSAIIGDPDDDRRYKQVEESELHY